jgi:NAD-dependent DNA ligase
MMAMNVVFTGTFKLDGEQVTRDVLIDLAISSGHRVHKSVNASVDTLVVGDTGRHGITRKLRTAASRGVTLMSPEEFLKAL